MPHPCIRTGVPAVLVLQVAIAVWIVGKAAPVTDGYIKTAMIRKATTGDISGIMSVIGEARATMAANGNPTQWPQGYPPVSAIEEDIATGTGYVMEEGNSAVAYFAFKPSPDTTYGTIYCGAWTDAESPYHVIHRVASRRGTRGVFAEVLRFCSAQSRNIRIDTHRNNTIMRHLLAKFGFHFCGIIRKPDGGERLAYQKIL